MVRPAGGSKCLFPCHHGLVLTSNNLLLGKHLLWKSVGGDHSNPGTNCTQYSPTATEQLDFMHPGMSTPFPSTNWSIFQQMEFLLRRSLWIRLPDSWQESVGALPISGLVYDYQVSIIPLEVQLLAGKSIRNRFVLILALCFLAAMIWFSACCCWFALWSERSLGWWGCSWEVYLGGQTQCWERTHMPPCFSSVTSLDFHWHSS